MLRLAVLTARGHLGTFIGSLLAFFAAGVLAMAGGMLLEAALLTRGHFLEAVTRIHKMGAESVVLTLGSRGALGLFANRAIEAVPPRVDAVSPIGSGDALAAAFVWAMERKEDFVDALRWGVATGTASALLPGMRFASRPQAEKIYKQVEVRKAEPVVLD